MQLGRYILIYSDFIIGEKMRMVRIFEVMGTYLFYKWPVLIKHSTHPESYQKADQSSGWLVLVSLIITGYNDHVIDLLKRICTVSVKTVEILKQMEQEEPHVN